MYAGPCYSATLTMKVVGTGGCARPPLLVAKIQPPRVVGPAGARQGRSAQGCDHQAWRRAAGSQGLAPDCFSGLMLPGAGTPGQAAFSSPVIITSASSIARLRCGVEQSPRQGNRTARSGANHRGAN